MDEEVPSSPSEGNDAEIVKGDLCVDGEDVLAVEQEEIEREEHAKRQSRRRTHTSGPNSLPAYMPVSSGSLDAQDGNGSARGCTEKSDEKEKKRKRRKSRSIARVNSVEKGVAALGETDSDGSGTDDDSEKRKKRKRRKSRALSAPSSPLVDRKKERASSSSTSSAAKDQPTRSESERAMSHQLNGVAGTTTPAPVRSAAAAPRNIRVTAADIEAAVLANLATKEKTVSLTSSAQRLKIQEKKQQEKKRRGSWSPLAFAKSPLFKRKGPEEGGEAQSSSSTAAAGADAAKSSLSLSAGSSSTLASPSAPSLEVSGVKAAPEKRKRQKRPISQMMSFSGFSAPRSDSLPLPRVRDDSLTSPSTPVLGNGLTLSRDAVMGNDEASPLSPTARLRLKQEQVASHHQNWLSRISSAADKMFMEQSAKDDKADHVPAALHAYARAIFELDDSSLLSHALLNSGTFADTLDELFASLRRNYSKKIVTPFKKVCKTVIIAEAVRGAALWAMRQERETYFEQKARLAGDNEQKVKMLAATNRTFNYEIMSSIVSYMEVYVSFFKIGRDRFKKRRADVLDFRSLIALEEAGIEVPENGSRFFPKCRDIIKQGPLKQVMADGQLQDRWFVLVFRCLYIYAARDVLVITGCILLDNSRVALETRGRGEGRQITLESTSRLLKLVLDDVQEARSWETAIDSCIISTKVGPDVERKRIQLVEPHGADEAATTDDAVPSSVHEFFTVNQFGSYWRQLRSEKQSMLSWIRSENVMQELLYLLTTDERAQAYTSQTAITEGEAGQVLMSEFAALAQTALTFNQKMMFGIVGKEHLEKLMLGFLKNRHALTTSGGVACYFETLNQFFSWNSTIMFKLLLARRTVMESCVANLDVEPLAKFVLGLHKFAECAPQRTVLNRLGRIALLKFLEEPDCDHHENRFENLSALLRLLVRKSWSLCSGCDEESFLYEFRTQKVALGTVRLLLHGNQWAAPHVASLMNELVIARKMNGEDTADGYSYDQIVAQLFKSIESVRGVLGAGLRKVDADKKQPVGMRRLSVLKVLHALLHHTQPSALDEQFVSSGIFSTVIRLMHAYPQHSLLLKELEEMIVLIFTNEESHRFLVNYLVDETTLIDEILFWFSSDKVDAIKEAWGCPRDRSLAINAHLLQVANAMQRCDRVSRLVGSDEDWQKILEMVAEANALQQNRGRIEEDSMLRYHEGGREYERGARNQSETFLYLISLV